MAVRLHSPVQLNELRFLNTRITAPLLLVFNVPLVCSFLPVFLSFTFFRFSIEPCMNAWMHECFSRVPFAIYQFSRSLMAGYWNVVIVILKYFILHRYVAQCMKKNDWLVTVEEIWVKMSEKKNVWKDSCASWIAQVAIKFSRQYL